MSAVDVLNLASVPTGMLFSYVSRTPLSTLSSGVALNMSKAMAEITPTCIGHANHIQKNIFVIDINELNVCTIDNTHNKSSKKPTGF